MTGLAHLSRFSHETARRIIERPDLHGHEHLRAACTWLTIHGDWLDVSRAAAQMRALDRGEKPGPLPPRGSDVEGPVSNGHRMGVFASLAGDKAHRLALARQEADRYAVKARIRRNERIGWALVACMALIALAAALGLAVTIWGRP